MAKRAARPGQESAAKGSKPAAQGVVSAARAAAFALLEQIGATSAHSDDVLHGPRLAGMSQVDRDLTTALVLGVLRWQIALDARLRPLLTRPDASLAAPVAIALRLGAFQLLHTERIPVHAAVNESVELVRAADHAHAAGMVNAVLRKLAAAGPVRKPLVESTLAMADRLGHPLWLVERWVGQYGWAAAEAICAAGQEEPHAADIFGQETDGAKFPVMDAGSRLVAELAAAVGHDATRVWDCCAAPGGKTMVLAQRLPGAELLATDTSAMRLRRLGQRLGRELPQRELQLEEADAAALPDRFGKFDLVLCDVPCSGTGTLARNPEIRHRLRPDDLTRQAERQRRILEGALERLAPGGRLVYSTCSLEREECEAVVGAALNKAAGVIRSVPVDPWLTELRSSGRLRVEAEEISAWQRGGNLRTLPGVGFAGDGFSASVLQRA